MIYNGYAFVCNRDYSTVPVSVLKRPLSEIHDVKDQNYIYPDSFILYQNFPNPFNPDTQLTWQQPVNSWQTLKIYDLLGDEIASLVDGYKEAGSHKVEFSVGSDILL